MILGATHWLIIGLENRQTYQPFIKTESWQDLLERVSRVLNWKHFASPILVPSDVRHSYLGEVCMTLRDLALSHGATLPLDWGLQESVHKNGNAPSIGMQAEFTVGRPSPAHIPMSLRGHVARGTRYVPDADW